MVPCIPNEFGEGRELVAREGAERSAKEDEHTFILGVLRYQPVGFDLDTGALGRIGPRQGTIYWLHVIDIHIYE